MICLMDLKYLINKMDNLIKEYTDSKSGQCSGRCCSEFSLPMNEQELEEKYDAYIKDKSAPHLKDIEVIYPMLIYKFSRRLIENERGQGSNGETNFWTCRHYNEETKKCNIYWIRPHFCRTFPNNIDRNEDIQKKCFYSCCTFKHNESKVQKILSEYAIYNTIKMVMLLDFEDFF